MSTTHKDIAAVVSEHVNENQIEEAAKLLKGLPPVDIADALTFCEPAVTWTLLERMSKRVAIFSEFSEEHQVSLSEHVPRAIFAKLLSQMPADERTDLFKRLSKKQREALFPVLAQTERENIRKLSSYQEGTAGALMTSDYAMLKAAMSVSKALSTLRREAPNAETIYHTYVTDDNRRLIGVVSLRELILAHPDKLIQDLMTHDVVSGHVDEDQESIAKRIARYDLIALPIIDASKQLVGIVTHDDAMDVAHEEATEDIHRSAGVTSSLGNMKNAKFSQLYRKRVFWLVLLVFANLLSGAGIAHFEETIATHLVLIFFLPLLVGSGGNAGSQSATLMVRALATGEVVMKDWFVLLGRETLVALALGATMAVAVSVLGYIRGDESIALVLALSMVSIVLIGCLLGMSLPFVLNKLGLDPASASAPLITSVCDVTGVVVYLFIANHVLMVIG